MVRQLDFVSTSDLMKPYNEEIINRLAEMSNSIDWDVWDRDDNLEYYEQVLTDIANKARTFTYNGSTFPMHHRMYSTYKGTIDGVERAIKALLNIDLGRDDKSSWQDATMACLWYDIESTIGLVISMDDEEGILLHLLGSASKVMMEEFRAAGENVPEEDVDHYVNRLRNILDKYDKDRYYITDLSILAVVVVQEQFKFILDNDK